MKKILSLFFLFFLPFNINATEIDLSDRISTQNFFRENHDLIYGSTKYSDRTHFKKIYHTLTLRTRKRIDHFIKSTKPHVPEKILMPLIYWRFLRNNKTNTAKTLTYLFFDKVLVLRDYAEDPLNPTRIKVHNILREVTRLNQLNTDEIYKKVFPLFKEKSKLLANLKQDDVFIQALMETQLFTLNLREILGHSRSYQLSPYGFIPGNKVEVLHDSRTSREDINWYNQNVIFNGGVLDFNASFIQMPYRNSQKGHLAFKKDPLLKSLKKMIDNAQKSIFIDMHLIGGTIGATFIEHLLDKTKEKLLINNNFRVLILHDFTSSGMIKKEVMPVFKYLSDRIKKDKDLENAVFLLQSNIQRHQNEIPLLLNENFSHSRIDNSKVMVIDANTKSPEAWVSTKNLTDHDGGYHFNSASHIMGPAAAIIQNSFVKDIEAALTNKISEQNLFYSKNLKFENSRYISRRKEIIDSFTIKRNNRNFTNRRF